MSDLFRLFNLLDSSAGTEGEVPAGGGMSMIFSIGFLLIMFGVMYFLMIRPQKKKEKAVKAMLDALKVGDRVCTIGGIYGTVTGVKDDQVIIAVGAQKTVMNMARWAIKSVEDAPLESDKAPEI
ncbi:MAG: preprotein translocase subunit YajC [Clostridia bacterium]|nr:preprotein translocase subunit YajC [Clostridia bacterium]